MKIMKKILPLLICLMLVVSMGVYVNAAGGETNLSYNITSTQVDINEEFTLTISIEDMTASAFKGGFYFDNSKLEVSKITWYNIGYYSESEEDDTDAQPMSKTTKKNANADGSALGVYLFDMGTDSECYGGAFVTVIFKATAAGDATITLREETTGTDAFKSDSVETITVTIKGAACDHEGKTYTYEANNDGTHKVICSCGETVDADEACDINKSTKKCYDCGADCLHLNFEASSVKYVYNGNGTHEYKVFCNDCNDWGVKDAAQACVDANGDGACDLCHVHDDWKDNGDGTCSLNCSCGKTEGPLEHTIIFGTCSRCGGNSTAHTHDLTEVPAVVATCVDTGVKAYYECGCGKYFTDNTGAEEITDLITWMTTEGLGKLPVDPTNHTKDTFTYVNNNNGTDHTKKYECCGAVADAAESHDFNAGDCVCGQAKPVTKYTLTVRALGSNISVNTTIQVEAGAKILAVLNDNGIELSTHYYDNYKVVYRAWAVDGGQIDADYEMPAENIEVYPSDELYTGWWLDDGTYAINGETQKTGWTLIDTADYTESGTEKYWVYLDPTTGVRAEGIVRVPYPTEKINGVTYAADAETIAYCESKGEDFIDETTGLFLFANDGKFQSSFTGLKSYEGKDAVELDRYFENGQMVWNPGFVYVDEVWYYFIGDIINGGNKPAEGDIYNTRDNDSGYAKGGIYNFVDGKLSDKNGVVDGKYYEGSQLMIGAGLKKLSDGYIYVRSTGAVAIGDYWVTNTNGICKSRMFSFDKNGYAANIVDPSINGIHNGFYYENGETEYAGLIEIDGETYYVKSNGQLATGYYYITKIDGYTGDLNVKVGDRLNFGTDGKLVK